MVAERQKTGIKQLNTTAGFIIAIILLFIIVLFTYRNAADNSFVDWDDFTYVVNNDLVRNTGESGLKEIFTTPVSSNYHPVTMLSLRLNNNTCKTCPDGISPAPFIKWNVFLHILNTALVFILVFLLFSRNILLAFMAALLFGVHPMHVESVAWISERKDLLYSFFFLSGLITYIKFISRENRNHLWLFATFVLFVLSALSKATAVVFPVVLLLVDFWLYKSEHGNHAREAIRHAFSFKNLFRLIPFFIVSLLIGIMAYKLQNGENIPGLLSPDANLPDVVNEIGPFSVFQRIRIASFGLVTYLVKFFAPVNLSALYPYPMTEEFNSGMFAVKLWLSFAGVLVIASLVLFSLKKTKLFAFGLGFYLVTVALVLQFISVGLAITADRYTYLPYIGTGIVVVSLLLNSRGRLRTLLLFLYGCFIILMILLSGNQIMKWNDTESLWTSVIDKYPDAEIPRRSRGKYYSRVALQAANPSVKTKYEDLAFTDFTAAIKAGSRNADVFEGIGCIYGSRGDNTKALAFLNSAIELDPEKGSAYFNRALILGNMNMNEEAIKDYNLALEYQPQKELQVRTNRYFLLMLTGRFPEAIRDLDYLISVDAGNFIYYYNRALAREQINDIKEAVSDYLRALALNPEDEMTMAKIRKLTGKQ